MRSRLTLIQPAVCAAAGLVLFLLGADRVAAAENGSVKIKLEAQLLWGTTNRLSPDPNHKPVEADVLKKLLTLPLKWTNYFVVNHKTVEVSTAAPVKTAMSAKCEFQVKYLGSNTVEVAYFGNGEQQVKQAMPKGETLVVAGNAPDATSWLVVLRRLE